MKLFRSNYTSTVTTIMLFGIWTFVIEEVHSQGYGVDPFGVPWGAQNTISPPAVFHNNSGPRRFNPRPVFNGQFPSRIVSPPHIRNNPYGRRPNIQQPPQNNRQPNAAGLLGRPLQKGIQVRNVKENGKTLLEIANNALDQEIEREQGRLEQLEREESKRVERVETYEKRRKDLLDQAAKNLRNGLSSRAKGGTEGLAGATEATMKQIGVVGKTTTLPFQHLQDLTKTKKPAIRLTKKKIEDLKAKRKSFKLRLRPRPRLPNPIGSQILEDERCGRQEGEKLAEEERVLLNE